LAVEEMRIFELLVSGATESGGGVCGGGEAIGIILLFVKSTDFRCLSRQKQQTAKPMGKIFPVQV
jgi:hypothetical protein